MENKEFNGFYLQYQTRKGFPWHNVGFRRGGLKGEVDAFNRVKDRNKEKGFRIVGHGRKIVLQEAID